MNHEQNGGQFMLKRLGKDSLTYGVSDFITSFVSFFTFPFIATALTPASFGVLELILTVTGLLGLLMNCGLNNAVARFYWDVDTGTEDRPSIVTSGLAAQFLFGIAIILLGVIAIKLTGQFVNTQNLLISSMAMFFGLVFMALSQWHRFILDVLRLHFAAWKFVFLSVVSKVGSALLGLIVVVYLGWGVEGLLGAQSLVLLLILPVGLYLISKDLNWTIHRGWLTQLVHYGHPFIFAGLAYNLLGTVDRWMLLHYSTVEEVGIYSVAFKFSLVVLMFSSAFGMAWSPMAMKIRTEHPDSYRKIYTYILLFVLYAILILAGGVALFSGEIIALIMGEMYYASAIPLAILCFGIVFKATEQVTLIGISIEKKTYLFARLTWMVTIINILANWLLIPRYGALGAALATVLSYFFLTASFVFFSQRLHPIPLPWDKIIYLLLLGLSVAVVSFVFYSTSVNGLYIVIKMGVAALCLLLGYLILPLSEIKKLNLFQ